MVYTKEDLLQRDTVIYKELIEKMAENNTAELRYTNNKKEKDKSELWFIHDGNGKYEKVIVLFNGEYPIFRKYICSCGWIDMLRKYQLADTTLPTEERKR